MVIRIIEATLNQISDNYHRVVIDGTTNPGETQKPDNPPKKIRNLIPKDPDNPLKGIWDRVQKGTRIEWPRGLTIPT